MESPVLNYTLNASTKCSLEGPLKMILWAGDGLHNGIPDVERLPGYHIYLCLGFVHGLQANIDFLSSRETPGYICLIDIHSPEQMTKFTNDFQGRFSLIDSDYHGNTPRMLAEYYSTLLSEGGEAYNIEGINGLVSYRSDYMNALETFGPVLNANLHDERRYTKLMNDLARDNDLQVDMAWTSPDLKDPYYDDIRKGQVNHSTRMRALNPNHLNARLMGEDRLEEYWSQLSDEILIFNKSRAEYEAKVTLEELFDPSRWNRFTKYLTQKVEGLVQNLEEFKEYTEYDFGRVQHVLKLSLVAKNFTGFSIHYGFYNDSRKEGSPRVYGLWISKPRRN